jgi:protein arginine kinase
MKLQTSESWLGSGGPDGDVVVSSRVRLARNVAGFQFVRRSSDAQRREVVNVARSAITENNPSTGVTLWVDMQEASPRDRQLLVERHLVSKQFAEAEIPRAVAITRDERTSIMVNEEDHLRMQALLPGLRLADALQQASDVDDAIESRIDYAFDSRWGYLTACPTNVGCGIRLSVMLHMPALRITNEIEKVRRAASDLNLAVRGFYGEGSESAGDLYQISNQITLGLSEQDLLEQFERRIVPRIVDYERQARAVLIRRNPTLLDDRVHRALAVLCSARLLGVDEVMKLLSRVRLGIYADRLPGVEVGKVNGLFLQIQPAHLQLAVGRRLGTEQLREARADLVRRTLAVAP